MKTRILRNIGVALWLIALLAATGVHAASQARLAVVDPAIGFSPPSSSVNPGSVFVVDVVVDHVTDLGAFEFEMAFDPAVVHVQGVVVGPFLGSTGNSVVALGPTIDNVLGKLDFGAFTLPPRPAAGPNDTGTVARITLQAVGSGSTALTFAEARLTNTAAGLLLPLTTTPGSVTVSGPTPTPTSTLQRSRVYLPMLRKQVP